jgi:hypothetical protein
LPDCTQIAWEKEFVAPDTVAGEVAMRTGIVVATLLTSLTLPAVPSALTAQRIRLPRIGRRTEPPAAPLPKEMPEVSRSLAYRRLRWSADGYSLLSSVRIPLAGVSITSYNTLGTGTHAAYALTDHSTATVDASASFLGSPLEMETIEVGSRYSPMTWEHSVRPFFDLRGGFMRLTDNYAAPPGTLVGGGGLTTDPQLEYFYGRGFGGVMGVGTEFTLTRSFALSTEISTMRNRMTTYQRGTGGGLPQAQGFWMTNYRFAFGLKYSPVRVLHLAQNPRQ